MFPKDRPLAEHQVPTKLWVEIDGFLTPLNESIEECGLLWADGSIDYVDPMNDAGTCDLDNLTTYILLTGRFTVSFSTWSSRYTQLCDLYGPYS
ncbi:hypothetical protein EB796_021497 [Bugula neritina]|uniref:Uncharacterized protein n=1 Tax=Bugula neritina TaxID=10212 RepID=A0A7J7J1Z0_BUGNE|nr:hypothetical protein EB796_021497 [Bugula neritina]